MEQDEQHSIEEAAHSHTHTKLYDDDDRIKRTGTVWTASSHIITAVVGSGVLSLAWAIAQLGWIVGPSVMLFFSLITWYTSSLLAECYRIGDPHSGKRNYTFVEAVHTILGGFNDTLCGIVQYTNLYATAIGYTIAGAISMMGCCLYIVEAVSAVMKASSPVLQSLLFPASAAVMYFVPFPGSCCAPIGIFNNLAIKRSECLHSSGGKDQCHISSNPYMIAFGVIQIFFSQIPDFHKMWWLSIIAAIMSFTYSFIGLGLAIAKVAENGSFKGSLTGVSIGTVTKAQKIWGTFQALGNIAFAYSYSQILIEIQDTIKTPPSEVKTMNQATRISIGVTTTFYLLCGCMGYAAFGDTAPGNILTGIYKPYWLIDIANAAIVIHIVGAYQVYAQPVFAFVEKRWQVLCLI
ncbi:amino acid permease [Trifolium pratense]|uniref:Amino acid permease n=1 Tax=Trifolium pratense TaxID=57577 RepID=A0A2K3NM47_TRIPR|nr:amino acid permease [Trifolium pratense]